jgi:hypothetical protein
LNSNFTDEKINNKFNILNFVRNEDTLNLNKNYNIEYSCISDPDLLKETAKNPISCSPQRDYT